MNWLVKKFRGKKRKPLSTECILNSNSFWNIPSCSGIDLLHFFSEKLLLKYLCMFHKLEALDYNDKLKKNNKKFEKNQKIIQYKRKKEKFYKWYTNVWTLE